MADRAHPEIPGDRLVFVGGLHRSGTTAVSRVPGACPEISGLTWTNVEEDEGQHLQSVYLAASRHGGPGHFGFRRSAHLTEADPISGR